MSALYGVYNSLCVPLTVVCCVSYYFWSRSKIKALEAKNYEIETHCRVLEGKLKGQEEAGI